MRLAFTASALLWLTACSTTSFTGAVTDFTGDPVAGALVTAVGQPCQTLTDEAGAFELPCSPGTYTLTIGQTGYISQSFEDFDATAKQPYDLGEVVLIKLPERQGLLLLQDKRWTELDRGWLIRNSGGRGVDQYRHYCLPEAATADEPPFPVNELAAGTTTFFDNESDGWRPWKLDDEGCAYRMSPKNETQWDVDYSEKAAFKTVEVTPERDIVTMELEPGEYFISDWGNGFFNKTATDDPKVQGFGGWYLRVK